MAKCDDCGETVHCCNCDGELASKTFYRVKPFDWSSTPARRHGTSYAIEEVRVVATSRNEADATRLVARLNEWKKLKVDNARLLSKLADRDTGKIELYRVENIVEDEVKKTLDSWAWCAGRANLATLAKRIVTRCGWKAE